MRFGESETIWAKIVAPILTKLNRLKLKCPISFDCDAIFLEERFAEDFCMGRLLSKLDLKSLMC